MVLVMLRQYLDEYVMQIEFYEVYKNTETNDLKCIIKFGTALNGHPV